MLTVALVATLAAGALWQQWRDVEVESAELARVQSQWVLTGALDWARLILREDGRTPGADHLAEPWAVPLQEARLSTFLAADKSTPVDADTMTQTFLSGQIIDLQSRMNLRNLADGGKVSDPALQAFAKLFQKLRLPPEELATLAENLRLALDPGTDPAATALAPLMPQRVNQLGWLGLSPQSLATLAPYVTLLPVPTPVNLNTADVIVLYACIPTLDMAKAQLLVNTRLTSHFRTLDDAARLLGGPSSPLTDAQHSIGSRFFEVHGRLRQDQVIVEQYSVLQRDGMDVKTLWKDGGPQSLSVTSP
jgi:general secretion pathway protein K